MPLDSTFLKLAKSVFMAQNFFPMKHVNMGIKNAEFYADLKIFDVGFQKCS
jgi:hypothetical protein